MVSGRLAVRSHAEGVGCARFGPGSVVANAQNRDERGGNRTKHLGERKVATLGAEGLYGVKREIRLQEFGVQLRGTSDATLGV